VLHARFVPWIIPVQSQSQKAIPVPPAVRNGSRRAETACGFGS
jgi:hypothetical protein